MAVIANVTFKDKRASPQMEATPPTTPLSQEDKGGEGREENDKEDKRVLIRHELWLLVKGASEVVQPLLRTRPTLTSSSSSSATSSQSGNLATAASSLLPDSLSDNSNANGDGVDGYSNANGDGVDLKWYQRTASDAALGGSRVLALAGRPLISQEVEAMVQLQEQQQQRALENEDDFENEGAAGEQTVSPQAQRLRKQRRHVSPIDDVHSDCLEEDDDDSLDSDSEDECFDGDVYDDEGEASQGSDSPSEDDQNGDEDDVLSLEMLEAGGRLEFGGFALFRQALRKDATHTVCAMHSFLFSMLQ
jgi:hypothetical protein